MYNNLIKSGKFSELLRKLKKPTNDNELHDNVIKAMQDLGYDSEIANRVAKQIQHKEKEENNN